MKPPALALVALVLLPLGCGDDGAAGPSDDTPVNAVTTEGKKEICDWVAMSWGGYGVVVPCGSGGAIAGPKSQSDCLAKSFPNCNAKLGAVKACVAAIARVKCELLTSKMLPPECQGLPAGCFMSD